MSIEPCPGSAALPLAGCLCACVALLGDPVPGARPLPQPADTSLLPNQPLPAGTRTARCARWCWRTRAARTATPAAHTSTAGTPSRRTAERRQRQWQGSTLCIVCCCFHTALLLCTSVSNSDHKLGQQGAAVSCSQWKVVARVPRCWRQLPAAACWQGSPALITRLRLSICTISSSSSLSQPQDEGPQPCLHLPAAAGRPAGRLLRPGRPGWTPHGTQ